MHYKTTRPGFIVEGHLEQDFVQLVCEGSPVRRIGCNGTDVKIDAIAKRVATHVRLLQRKCNPIVVVFDREGRNETCEALETSLKESLKRENITANVIVGIPDRDIESWILADFESFARSAGIDPKSSDGQFEGKKCKCKVKDWASGKCNYTETIHGVAWLKNAHPQKIRQASPSFARFFEALKGLSCRWLQQELPLIE